MNNSIMNILKENIMDLPILYLFLEKFNLGTIIARYISVRNISFFLIANKTNKGGDDMFRNKFNSEIMRKEQQK